MSSYIYEVEILFFFTTVYKSARLSVRVYIYFFFVGLKIRGSLNAEQKIDLWLGVSGKTIEQDDGYVHG